MRPANDLSLKLSNKINPIELCSKKVVLLNNDTINCIQIRNQKLHNQVNKY